MDQLCFNNMLDEIYSAFGRQRPAAGTPSYRSIWRRVCEDLSVPDEAARYISHALCDRDSLPLNLGKAILSEFYNWLSEHPERRAQATACRDCDPEMPGFFWAWDTKGKRFIFKCACNQDPCFEKFQAWTRRRAQQAGYSLQNPIGSGDNHGESDLQALPAGYESSDDMPQNEAELPF